MKLKSTYSEEDNLRAIVKKALGSDKWLVFKSKLADLPLDYGLEDFVSTLKHYLFYEREVSKRLDIACDNRVIKFSSTEYDKFKELIQEHEALKKISSIRTADGRGVTIKLREAHLVNNSSARILNYFQMYMNPPIGLNVYYTTQNSGMCIPAHRDAGDIFILQISGRKKWFMEPKVSDLDLMDNPEGRGVLTDSVDLEPGDILFLPQQLGHRTETSPVQDSLHLTIQGNSNVVQWLADGLRYWFNGYSEKAENMSKTVRESSK